MNRTIGKRVAPSGIIGKSQRGIALRARAPEMAHQAGSIVLWLLLMLSTLLMFGAFAVDAPRIVTAHDELQNAADAAALAGAAGLWTGANGPNWTAATTAATAAIPLNMSDNKTLSSGAVLTGYWDLSASAPTVQSPSAVTLPAATSVVPAVQVTITRNATTNGGLVTLLLGALLGKPSVAASVTAVAVATSPSTVPAGGLFPVVLNKCLYDQYWNAKTDEPQINPSTNAPYQFQIGNGQSYGASCAAGQWTSFLTTLNNVPTIRDLLASGNPSSVSIGSSIWILPGVKDTVYSSVPAGVTVIVPIVNSVAANTMTPVVAFGAFYIEGAYGGSNKYIQGHFVGGYKIPTQGTGIGPNYGGYVAPRLAF